MDGNRRWADQNNRSRVSGHKEGILAIERVIARCIYHSIPYATFYAFSAENWRRDEYEVRYLLRLMHRYLALIKQNQLSTHLYNRVQVRFIGDKMRFPPPIQSIMEQMETRDLLSSDCQVAVAVSYSGRDEILQAINLGISEGITQFDQAALARFLYAPHFPDPDLIVRTSGVKRLSNFLTWQSVYSELLFVNKFWPEINDEDIDSMVSDFRLRERKYGA
jgi:undecaprenyl diphosphate synthase